MAAPPPAIAGRTPFDAPVILPQDRLPPEPHSLDAEESIIGGCIIRNETFREIHLSTDDFYDPRHALVWRAMAELDAEGEPIDEVTIAATLQAQRRLERVGGRAYIDQLGLRVPTADNARHYAGIVHDLAVKRRVMHACSRLIERAPNMDADQLLEAIDGLVKVPRNGHGTANGHARRIGRRGTELAKLIMERADDPWVTLSLGGEIASIRAGGIVIIMGPSGGGKSSFTAALALAHAREAGPAIYLSRELPADELAARMVGMQTESSWKDVLVGRVPLELMEQVLALPRLIVIDRKDANLDTLAAELRATRLEYPTGPILVAIDYTQIIPSTGTDARSKVADAMERTDELAREYGAVVLVISQMSRVNARSARTGESLGAETTDGGAESAAIERYASLTLTVGSFSAPADDGSQTAQLSIGKYRMGLGDRVIPMRYDGRTGRWRVDGESRAAAEVRAEKAAAVEDAKVGAAVRAMRDRAASAPEPITREDLRAAAAVSKTMAKAAIEQMLKSGELVEVQKKRPRANAWLVWTADRAAAAGLPIVPREGVSTAARPMNSDGSTAGQL